MPKKRSPTRREEPSRPAQSKAKARPRTSARTETLVRQVSAAFRYEGPISGRTKPLGSLAKLPAALRHALEQARAEACRGGEKLTFEGFYVVLGVRSGKPIAYAAFAADRHVNYTFGRYVAVTPSGAPLVTKLEVGD